ncbi:MAG: DUF1801 domain-containing protein [Ardenticatenaceae bacterium]|nr:DUF1801 domain-containing protein [Ardenticatenaceae bacterium]
MSNDFEEMLTSASPEVAALARQAKTVIQNVMPNVVEVVWLNQNIAGYGVGPKKMSEQFCYIALFKARLNLGFYYGSDLPDPEKLLEGSGKNLRHIKISHPEQLQNPALHDLVVAASKHLPKLKK